MLEKLFEIAVGITTVSTPYFELKIEPHTQEEEVGGFINIVSQEQIFFERVGCVGALDYSPTADSIVNNILFIGQVAGIIKITNGVFPNLQTGLNFLGLQAVRNTLFCAFLSGDGFVDLGAKSIHFQNQTINEIYTPFFPIKALALPNWQFPSTLGYLGSGDDRLYLIKYLDFFSLAGRGEGFFNDEKTFKMDRRFLVNKPLFLGLLTVPPIEGLYRVQGFVGLSS